MKIRAIASYNLNIYKQNNSQIKRENTSLRKNIEDDDILTSMPCYYPISFSGIQNSSKLRMLFAYRIPFMYTLIETIDPKSLNRWMKNNLFLRPMAEVMPVLEPFWDTLTAQKVKHIPNLPFEVETKVWEIIKEISVSSNSWLSILTPYLSSIAVFNLLSLLIRCVFISP